MAVDAAAFVAARRWSGRAGWLAIALGTFRTAGSRPRGRRPFRETPRAVFRRPARAHGKVLLAAMILLFGLGGLAREAAADPPAADPWWGPDKAAHFGVSAAIAGGGYAIGVAAFDDPAPRALLGAGLGLGAGATKEALDAAGLGTPSWKDFVWDLVGVAVGVGIGLTIDLSLRSAAPARAR